MTTTYRSDAPAALCAKCRLWREREWGGRCALPRPRVTLSGDRRTCADFAHVRAAALESEALAAFEEKLRERGE